MESFEDKVAVITGGASGIGLGLATALAERGALVAIADIEEPALARAYSTLIETTSAQKVAALEVDVSRYESVVALRDKVIERFGRVDLLVNNAGVCTFNPLPQVSIEDWQWVIGVDLWGVIHGVKAFVDLMVAQDTEGHIVNTASLAGVIRGNRIITPYSVAKHGVVALSEALREELRSQGAKLGVTVLCPAHVRSNAWDSDRNRPGGREVRSDIGEAWRSQGGTNPGEPSVLSAAEFAGIVLQAVRAGDFWVFTDPPRRPALEERFSEILGAYPSPV